MKTGSLEIYVNSRLGFLAITFVALFCLTLWRFNVPFLWVLIASSCLAISLFIAIKKIGRKILSAFERATFHLEAINQDDFNQYAKPAFPSGKVREFHHQLNQLSKNLQQQKSRYDQHIFLVYQLIEQLDTPILVFNQKQQLTFGNAEFQNLFGQPWQMLRHASARLLGLSLKKQQWHLNDSYNKKIQVNQWQIRQSEFIEQGETHQLLIFINIGVALRQSQLHAWQQIIRVLSHEIRNSLTPVSSLAESLLDKADKPKDKQALEVITERCQHLQEFVERYSSFSKHLQLSCQQINSRELLARLANLFINVDLKIINETEYLWIDAAFFEQVLINLIKNAIEADATKITLTFKSRRQYQQIIISDNGHGFANLGNSFIPLYSTKPQGQGIGLSFCKNIIEQHNGSIELTNNNDSGVSVTIKIPNR